ncbi:MAG TPA: histidine kinase [Anaerolineae bacterium]|nr:histidine kinase [Anaerolineae bacterium]
MVYNDVMRLIRLPISFRRLRWKLTFSYTAVTVAVLLTLVAVSLLGSFFFGPASGWLNHYLELAIDQAAEADPFLETALPDSTLTEVWLRTAIPNDWAVIVSPAGHLLAANRQEEAGEARPGQPFVDPRAREQSQQLIGMALEGKPAVLGLGNGTIVAAAPIVGEGEQVLGILYVRGFSGSLVPGWNLAAGLAILASSLIGLTVAAGLIGTLFGRLTSRGLVRRLESLSSAAEAWGQGNFSVTVRDASPDEIGHLARGMSQMAVQIQVLLQARQDLATLEERNRLARDLHDSVKQQAFATTMTLGAAKTWRERDPEAAWEMIDEAEDLSYEVQQELTSLIHELRPVELEGKGLAAALQEYGARWSRQTGNAFSLALHGECIIPPDVEKALFRLAQEALANVAKHSGAKHADVTLVCTESAITMKVADDGHGFDPESVADKGLGLRSMRERIEALDGELTVESAPGAGTRLVARCGPVRARTGLG